MKKLFIILIAMLFLLSSFVLAGEPPQNSLVDVYYFPTNVSTLIVDESNATTQYNATSINDVVITQDDFNSANMTFDSTNKTVDLNAALIPATGHFSISIWAYIKDNNNNGALWAQYDVGEIGRANVILQNNIRVFIEGRCDFNSGYISENEWHHIVVTYDGGVTKLYIDGALNSSASGSGAIYQSRNTYIGSTDQISSNFFNGSISNFLLYNDDINSTVVEELYNLSRIHYYDYTESVISINELNISPNIINENNNLTCNYNVTGADNITFNWYKNESSLNINSSIFNNSNFYLSDTIVCELTAHNTTTDESLSQNVSKLIGQSINFTAWDLTNSTSINEFNITYDSTTISTSTGSIFRYFWNDTINFNFDSDGYALSNQTLFTNVSSQTYNFTVFVTNSINITFLDSDNLSLITEEISVEIIGNLVSYNQTTTTGSLYVDLINPDTYVIRYSASGYNLNFYFLTVADKSSQTLTLYLTRNSTTTVTATVYDEKTLFVEDARIKVQSEDPTDPSQYITSQMCDTNFEGKCQLELQLNTKLYKFTLEFPAGNVVKITNPSYIFDSAIDFQVIIGELAAEDFLDVKDVYGFVTWDNDTNTFSYTYNDPNNVISQGCLQIYEISVTGKTLLQSTCSNSVSDTIDIIITPQNDTSYLAQGVVYYDSELLPIAEIGASFRTEDPDFGKSGAFMLIFLIITFVAIALWNPVILLILLPFPLTLGSMIGFLDIQWPVLLGIHFVFTVLAYAISDRG